MSLLNYFESVAYDGAFDPSVLTKHKKCISSKENEIIQLNNNHAIREAVSDSKFFADADDVTFI